MFDCCGNTAAHASPARSDIWWRGRVLWALLSAGKRTNPIGMPPERAAQTATFLVGPERLQKLLRCRLAAWRLAPGLVMSPSSMACQEAALLYDKFYVSRPTDETKEARSEAVQSLHTLRNASIAWSFAHQSWFSSSGLLKAGSDLPTRSIGQLLTSC